MQIKHNLKKARRVAIIRQSQDDLASEQQIAKRLRALSRSLKVCTRVNPALHG